jgi:hypothetical protein
VLVRKVPPARMNMLLMKFVGNFIKQESVLALLLVDGNTNNRR